jgi:hypothetical protein
MMRWLERRQSWLPWVLIILGPTILFGPMLARGRALFWGTPLLQFVPWREFALQTLRNGHLPLWNPDLGMGAPLVANYQSAIFYPPNWLLPITGVAWGQGLLVALHLIWAGIGMALLARRLGLGHLAQSIAGLSFSLSGYLVARAGFLSIINAAAWVPWVLLAIDRLVMHAVQEDERRGLRKAVLALSLLLAMQWLAGHAQTSWYTLLLACAWATWKALHMRAWRGLVRVGLYVLLSGMMAFALAAVQLLPTLEYLAHSYRATALDPEFALTYSFWPWRATGFLLPNLFGNPAHGDYWGYGNYWEDAVYLGVLPFILALVAAWRGIRGGDEHRSLRRFLLGLTLIAIVFALGKNTPIYPFLFEHIPSFNLFQAPARWNLIAVFALSLLAAFGAETWEKPAGRVLYWTRLGTAGSAMIAVTAILIPLILPEFESTFIPAFAVAGVLLTSACVLSLVKPERPHAAWATIVGLLVLADLVVIGTGLNPSVQRTVYQGRSHLAEELGLSDRVYMSPEIEYEYKYERTHRFDAFLTDIDWRVVRDAGLPNSTLLDGLASANNFDPILPERYRVWVEHLDGLPSGERQRLLAMMGVAWDATAIDSETLTVSYEHVPDAARFRFVPCATRADSPEQALSIVMDAGFDPDHTVVIEGEDATTLPAGGAGGQVVHHDLQDPNTQSFHVNSGDGTWLVVSDTWYPGWGASVDGQRVSLYRANYLFRAVWVPAGTHDVSFDYRPISFNIGAACSILAWLMMAFLRWRWRRD